MRNFFAAALVAIVACSALAAEVGGVKLDDNVKVGAGDLVLNGAGIRSRLGFSVYAAGLYLTEKKGSAADILALGGPKRVSMTMMRDVGAKTLLDALNDGIEANTPAAELEKLKPQMAELSATMTALGEAKKGEVVTLDFVPGTGTTISVNGQAKGKPIAGDDFYKALLRIWLGDRPVDGSLKKGLLGG